MPLDSDSIKKQIIAIGFLPENGKNGVYRKVYADHNEYTIFVDFNQGKIEYAADVNSEDSVIKVWGRTTSNFSQAENLVILECVNRLLLKGYAPCCIELEKTYPSGRGHSGRLDILVKREDGTPFLMIECKTWGAEYEKELGRMTRNGGQLFSYYSSDRDTEFLCLYASCSGEDTETESEFVNAVIDVDSAWRNLSGVKEIFDHWNKNYRDNGIFDRYSAPYSVRHRALTYGKLQTLKAEHSGKIYNQIMEILRHNAISDKPNAFNKLLNLFVCKIIDEDKNPDEELEFQWLENDTDESLQLRLNDLYKEGMWRFLDINIIDYTQNEVTQKLDNIDADLDIKRWIMRMYTDTRLKKSPNFAFVEVQDDKTFALNARVVREIVELLQVFKFRYEQKHEFLGNFFELLLNTSMKQEAGQFFTPVPITRFIISSLPLRELVQQRIRDRASEPLPTVIDYACGSGHFLTEYMSQMQKIIDSGIDLAEASPRVRKTFQSWQGFTKFTWARDVVYGIDLDNRLVKTAKVSAFFNGDGEAEIIWGNGLDHFSKSESYRGKLTTFHNRDNGQFDILISNPPYSVEAFKSTVKFGEESFELFPYITENSAEIECLFVERMKQLLKVGGWAAVILPSSILTNSGIYGKAREILLRCFYIKGIVELGSNTFMKTNVNTVILFLERRDENDAIAINREINRFFSGKKDAAVAGIENAFSLFVSNVYEDLPFDDYVSLFQKTPSDAMKQHELYGDYVRALGEDYTEKAVLTEKAKMLCFLLTYGQDVVLVKTGKKSLEKQFLGYEFSERRGHEGMHWLPGGTKLYDESNPLNPQKVSSYIYHAFLGEKTTVSSSLASNIANRRVCDLIEYGTSQFDRVIRIIDKRTKMESRYPLVKISQCVAVTSGLWTGEKPPFASALVIRNTNFTLDGRLNTSDIAQIQVEQRQLETRKLQKGDIILEKSGGSDTQAVGRVIFFDMAPAGTEYSFSNFTARLRCENQNIQPKYLFYVLNYVYQQGWTFAYQSGESGLKNLNMNGYLSFKIPLPPTDIQLKIVEEIELSDNEISRIHTEIRQQKQEIERIFDRADITEKVLLGQLVECNPSKAALSDVPDETMVSFVEMASVSNEGYIANAADRRLGDVRKGSYTYFKENDILIAKITPCMENGKCAMAVGLTNGMGMGSSEFHVFRCGARILPRYLFGYLNRTVVRQEAEKVMAGKSGHRRVPVTFYKQLWVPLPSLHEQQEIIHKALECERKIEDMKKRLHALQKTADVVLGEYLQPLSTQ